jgi:hypothetical protein
MSAGNKGINITSYLLGNQTKSNNKSVVTGNFTVPTINTGVTAASTRSSIWRILSYFLAILVIVFIILLFIHFFIKPIFKLRPGSPGIISVPGFDDGVLFWNKTTASIIQDQSLSISGISSNYSLIVDVFVENPLQFSTTPRIILTRGALLTEKPTGDTLLGTFSYYNLVAALLPDTNDLIVSTLNSVNNMENIVIPNVPVQTPFRLGIILMDNALEVYINGKLSKTRTLSSPPKDIKGDIAPAAGIQANITKVRNLKLWARVLSTAEIRDATPSLSSSADFGASPPSTTSTCASQLTGAADSVKDRISKLSAETVSEFDSALQAL